MNGDAKEQNNKQIGVQLLTPRHQVSRHCNYIELKEATLIPRMQQRERILFGFVCLFFDLWDRAAADRGKGLQLLEKYTSNMAKIDI